MNDVFLAKISEFLDVILSGIKARKKAGWEGNLSYGVNELKMLFNDSDLDFNDLDKFIIDCNTLIDNNMRYKNIDKLIIESVTSNEMITCVLKN